MSDSGGDNDGSDEVDGLLASLTDDYREPQPTIPTDVDDLIAATRPPPPRVPARETSKPAPAGPVSKVPRPPVSRIPRPGDATARPPSMNPAGPPRREPFPPSTSPAPATTRPLPRPSVRRFNPPTDFDEAEIDAVLVPLSEPPRPKTPTPEPDRMAKTVPPPPGLELPAAMDRAAESWNPPPDIDSESLEELDAVEVGDPPKTPAPPIEPGDRNSGSFESDGPTRTYSDELEGAPVVTASAASFEEWDDEAVTSLRVPSEPPPRSPSDSPTLDPDGPDASVEYTSASFEELGVVSDPDAAAAFDSEARGSVPPEAPRDFSSQRPAAAHLGDNRMTTAWVARAEWFEAEAATAADAAGRARLLLAASELWAMAGSAAKARDAARRAAQSNPALSLASRQTRWLSAVEGDWKAVATALDVESRSGGSDAERAHAAYLAAEVHRLALHDATAADRRLDLLSRTNPSDPRPFVMKLAAELGAQATPPKVRPPEGMSAEIAQATLEIARLRGLRAADEPRSPAVAFQDAARALASGSRTEAGAAVLSLRGVDGIGDGALFLAAALFTPSADTRAEAISALRELFQRAPGRAVKRALAARALEQGDPGAMTEALAESPDLPSAFEPPDRVALSALAGGSAETLRDAAQNLEGDETLRPLAAAATSSASAAASVPLGDPETRASLTLGRRISSVGALEELKDAIHAIRAALPDAPLGRVLSLELDAHAGATSAVAAELVRMAPSGQETDGKLVSALIEEAAGRSDVARRHYTAVLATASVAEAAARALIQSGVNGADLLSTLASTLGESPTVRQSLLLFEAAVRGRFEDKEATEDLLIRAHEAAPDLPFSARLGEDLARSRSDVPGLTAWLRRRRDGARDPIARALYLVREAFFIADEDASAAAARVVEAIAARPDDVALHELLERLDPTPSIERGKWRERIAEIVPDARTKSWLHYEARAEYERDGALDEARNAAQSAAAAGGSELAKIAAERIFGEQSEAPPDKLFLLRAREQELLGTDREDELVRVAAELVELPDPAEAGAHARLAVRLRTKTEPWESGWDLVERAARQFPRSLWTLRQLSAHARAAGDFARVLEADQEIAARTERPVDAGTLSLRAAEAAARLGRARDAVALLELTLTAVPDHLVARDLRAQLEEELGDAAAAAEDLEALGRACVGREYRWDAWYRAGVLWADRAANGDRALTAFEQAGAIDVTRRDLFDRLQLLYVERSDREKLAELLERRLAETSDPEERIALEVTRGRALADVGDRAAARQALGAALDADPDHVDALEVYASLSAADGDYARAEESWIRLARVFNDPERQAHVYRKLAELYETNLPNSERAEICYREILKRKPEDADATQGLVRVYTRSGDSANAVKLQTDLVERAATNDERRDRTIALARVYDEAAKDKKAALSVLEKARKTWPHDSALLKATAEHHQRYGESAAVNVLLDRASAEARRALAHGRFDPAFFGILGAAAEVKGHADAARLASASLAALENRGAEPIAGAGAAAGQPELDDLLAPELLSAPLRALLRKLPGILDAAYPLDLKSLRAGPVPPGAVDLVEEMRVVAESVGIRSLEILVSPALGPVFVPASSTPARIVMGQTLLESDDHGVRYFCFFRALKMIQSHSAVLSRISPIELWPAIAALVSLLAPQFQPQAVDTTKFADARRRVKGALPARIDDELATLALEVGGAIGNRASQLGQAVAQWASRTALLAVGDPALALRAVAAALGQTEGVPKDLAERLKWVQRHAEARDVLVFNVSEAYGELRRAVGLVD